MIRFLICFRSGCAYLFALTILLAPLNLRGENIFSDWTDDVQDTAWETGAALGTMTALGLFNWEWGSSSSFRWQPEGWFGMDTGSGGADKLGHAYTSYMLTNILSDRLIRKDRPPARAAISAAITTQLVMLYVEMFDAYSLDHGFAWEDCVMNLAGTGFAAARTVIPGMRDLVDYRMEYEPSGYKGFRPFSDYSGQKYLMALKLGGIDALAKTPLRYLELHGGYYTRGFSKEEELQGKSPVRYGFVGVGINFGELFFGKRGKREPELKNAGRLFFEHIQLPYTALHASEEL